jgi:hypothetical protein
LETVRNLSYHVTNFVAVTLISSVIIETHSAANRASSELNLVEKATSPTATICGRKKDVAECVIIARIAAKVEEKEVGGAKVAVGAVMFDVKDKREISIVKVSKLKLRKRPHCSIITSEVVTSTIKAPSSTA